VAYLEYTHSLINLLNEMTTDLWCY